MYSTFTATFQQVILFYHQIILYALPVVIVITLALLYVLRWRDYLLPYLSNKQRLKESDEQKGEHIADEHSEVTSMDGNLPETQQSLPKLSVVITTNNQFDDLVSNLPDFLSQDYPDFEVIIVDEASSEATTEYIKHLQLCHRKLRQTFVPASATHLCRKKFAITLGVRSARSEWIVVTHASAKPASKEWLRHMALAIRQDTDIVLGYANYLLDDSQRYHKACFDRLFMQLRCYRAALELGAIGGDASNFAFRKSVFMEQNGYADYLQTNWGESHLLIGKLAQRGNTAVAIDAESAIYDPLPMEEIEINEQVLYRATLQMGGWRTRFYRWRERFATLLIYLLVGAYPLYIALRLYQLLVLGQMPTAGWYIDSILVLLAVFSCWFPMFLLQKSTDLLGLPPYRTSLLLYSLRRPYEHLCTQLRLWRFRRTYKQQ